MIKKTALVAAAAFGLALAGCSEAPRETESKTLKLTVEVPPLVLPKGTLHVYTYNAWRGRGDLRHPLAPIEEYLEFEFDGGVIEHQFDYIKNSGAGFAVYAWLDTDGDGALCTPTKRDEFSGLTVLPEFADELIEVSVELSSPCAGPDRFFPKPKK